MLLRPLHEFPNAPYQSEAVLPQAADPPCNCPMILWFWSNRGEPDEPPSVVVLRSHDSILQCVPLEVMVLEP